MEGGEGNNGPSVAWAPGRLGDDADLSLLTMEKLSMAGGTARDAEHRQCVPNGAAFTQSSLSPITPCSSSKDNVEHEA